MYVLISVDRDWYDKHELQQQTLTSVRTQRLGSAFDDWSSKLHLIVCMQSQEINDLRLTFTLSILIYAAPRKTRRLGGEMNEWKVTEQWLYVWHHADQKR